MLDAQDLESKLEGELQASLEQCVRDVNSFMLPLQQRTEAVVDRVKGLQSQKQAVMEELLLLQQQAANIE